MQAVPTRLYIACLSEPLEMLFGVYCNGAKEPCYYMGEHMGAIWWMNMIEQSVIDGNVGFIFSFHILTSALMYNFFLLGSF